MRRFAPGTCLCGCDKDDVAKALSRGFRCFRSLFFFLLRHPSPGHFHFHWLLAAVVVHELCHLFAAGHGPDFYARMETYLPDYKERDRLLASLPRELI